MTEPKKSGGGHWPWIIVGLLVVNAGASGLLVAIANAGDGHAVEPDYYAKAVKWDDEMAQQRQNHNMGWKVESTLRAGDDGVVRLRASLTDREGEPVTGATISLETFHRARANDRLELELTESAPGVYTSAWTSERRGLWELRYTAKRFGQRFTHRVVGNTAEERIE